MKRILFFIIGLLLIPSLLFAQVDYSGKGLYNFITTDYHNITTYQAWVASQGYLTSANLTAYRLVADSYSTSETDILLNAKLDVTTAASTYATIVNLALKANSADVYTTAAVDLLLAAKLDTTAIANYYTKAQVDALLADKADTGTVALKIERTDYFTASLGGTVKAPGGSPTGANVLCDDGNFRSVASVGGGVTNAVDLNASTAAFSRIMNSLATNAQTALNQIDQNAATTAEVAAKANAADVYTKSETNDTIENAINAIPPPDLTNYYTKAQTNATIEAAIAAIPSSSQTVNVTAGEDLTAGDVVSLINSYGTVTAKKNNLAVNTSPNGAESVFQNSATSYIVSVALDASRFIVIYARTASNNPYAIIGTVSNSAISWGSESSVIEAINCYENISACKIATDKVLVCYHDATNSNGRMVVLSISNNTTITVNTPVDFVDGTRCYFPSVTALETDKALVVYREGAAGATRAKVITVSGTIPTPYPDVSTTGTQIDAGRGAYISASSLSASSVIAAYSDMDNSNYGTAQVLSISGTTITPGTEYVFNSRTTPYISVCSLDSTTAVIEYDTMQAGGAVIQARITSGTQIDYGTRAIINPSANIQHASITKIDASTALATFVNSGVNGYAYTCLVKKDGTGFLTPTAIQENSVASSAYMSACYLGNNKIAVALQSTSNYGAAFINTWATASYDSVRGLCTSNVSSGQTASVIIKGVATGLSGLINGSDYFVNESFELQTTPVSLNGNFIKAGIANSTTSLILE